MRASCGLWMSGERTDEKTAGVGALLPRQFVPKVQISPLPTPSSCSPFVALTTHSIVELHSRWSGSRGRSGCVCGGTNTEIVAACVCVFVLVYLNGICFLVF